MDDLFEAAEDPPGPVVRKAARGGFGHDVRPAPSRFFQDVQRPDEVDVGRPSRPDLVLGGEIEVAAGCGLGHRSPSRYFLCVLELLPYARAQDYGFAATVSRGIRWSV